MIPQSMNEKIIDLQQNALLEKIKKMYGINQECLNLLPNHTDPGLKSEAWFNV
jgi:hypothetical protein